MEVNVVRKITTFQKKYISNVCNAKLLSDLKDVLFTPQLSKPYVPLPTRS
jgi:hypothetical protein